MRKEMILGFLLGIMTCSAMAQDVMNAEKVTVLKGIAVEGVDTAAVH